MPGMNQISTFVRSESGGRLVSINPSSLPSALFAPVMNPVGPETVGQDASGAVKAAFVPKPDDNRFTPSAHRAISASFPEKSGYFDSKQKQTRPMATFERNMPLVYNLRVQQKQYRRNHDSREVSRLPRPGPRTDAEVPPGGIRFH
jgi:hypothetical protein